MSPRLTNGQMAGEILTLLVDRFPEDAPVITKLYGRSEEFRGICSDYADCAQTIARLTNGCVADLVSIREYQTLSQELREELKEIVRAHGS